jgi:DNA-binding transcriptional LysR family regulator
MTLTPDGYKFLDRAKAILSVADEALQVIRSDGHSGLLTIGSEESTAAARLPALLSSYHREWPNVQIEISIGTSPSLLDDVANGRLDCAFVPIADRAPGSGSNPIQGERGLQAICAFKEELLLIAPPQHRTVCSADTLAIDTIAVFAQGGTYRTLLEDWLSKPGIRETNWRLIEQTSYDAMLASVTAGLCFAICPRSILEMKRAPIEVRTLLIAPVDTYLVSRGSCRSAALEALLRSTSGRRVRL